MKKQMIDILILLLTKAAPAVDVDSPFLKIFMCKAGFLGYQPWKTFNFQWCFISPDAFPSPVMSNSGP